MENNTKNIEELLQEDFTKAFEDRYKSIIDIKFQNFKIFKNLISILKDKIEWQGIEVISLTASYIKISDIFNELKSKLEKKEISEDDEVIVSVETMFIDKLLYYLNKYKGKGFISAASFIDIYMPIYNIFNSLKEKDKNLQSIQREIDAWNLDNTIPERYKLNE